MRGKLLVCAEAASGLLGWVVVLHLRDRKSVDLEVDMCLRHWREAIEVGWQTLILIARGIFPSNVLPTAV